MIRQRTAPIQDDPSHVLEAPRARTIELGTAPLVLDASPR